MYRPLDKIQNFVQMKFQYSGRELVEQITKNLYLQYFTGLPGYREELPFDASTLVLFRKRMTHEIIMEANSYMLDYQDYDRIPSASDFGKEGISKSSQPPGESWNVDRCASVNIRFSQNISLLNEVQEKLETVIYRFCKSHGLSLWRRYMRKEREKYLSFAKAGKHSRKQIHKAIKKQLSYV